MLHHDCVTPDKKRREVYFLKSLGGEGFLFTRTSSLKTCAHGKGLRAEKKKGQRVAQQKKEPNSLLKCVMNPHLKRERGSAVYFIFFNCCCKKTNKLGALKSFFTKLRCERFYSKMERPVWEGVKCLM